MKWFIKEQVSQFGMVFRMLPFNGGSLMLLFLLKATSAQSCVAVSIPLGHVENYASALGCEPRLALHHFSNF